MAVSPVLQFCIEEKEMIMNAKPSGLLRFLTPGRTVELKDEDGTLLGTAKVYPAALRHMERFSNEVVSVAMVAFDALKVKIAGGKIEINQKAIEPDRVIQSVMPMLLQNGFGLIKDCVRLRLEGESEEYTLDEVDLPQWLVPEIVQAWIEESFGSEKKRAPWATFLNGILRRFEKTTTGTTADKDGEESSTLGMLSKVFSPQDTPAPTSSTPSSPAAPTGDGPCPSSDSSVNEPVATGPG